MFKIYVQKHKSQQTPQRFIEKTRVYRLQGLYASVGNVAADIICSCIAQHTPGKSCIRSEGFLVKKVAPASDGLTDKKAGCHNIKHCRQPQFPEFYDDTAYNYGAYKSAVNGKSAVTEIKELA